MNKNNKVKLIASIIVVITMCSIACIAFTACTPETTTTVMSKAFYYDGNKGKYVQMNCNGNDITYYIEDNNIIITCVNVTIFNTSQHIQYSFLGKLTLKPKSGQLADGSRGYIYSASNVSLNCPTYKDMMDDGLVYNYVTPEGDATITLETTKKGSLSDAKIIIDFTVTGGDTINNTKQYKYEREL